MPSNTMRTRRNRFRKYARGLFRGKRRFRRKNYRLGNPAPPLQSSFPANRIVKLKYVDRIVLNPATSDPYVEHIFSANSIHDPDVTSTGHQPMGYDQWATFYKNYTVIGSKISVKGITNSSGDPAIYGVRLTDLAASGHTSINGLIESPKISYRLIQNAINGNVPRAAVTKYSAKKWFNLNNVKDNERRVGAPVGSSPAEQAYFSVFYGPIASPAGIDVEPIELVINIMYIVLFSQPKELPQS